MTTETCGFTLKEMKQIAELGDSHGLEPVSLVISEVMDMFINQMMLIGSNTIK